MSEQKEKKYIIDNPVLMAEWNLEKNKELGLNPNELTIGSGKKAWWKCSKGHEWQATIANRKNGNGCPYCSNQRVLIGYNDLATFNPNKCLPLLYTMFSGEFIYLGFESSKTLPPKAITLSLTSLIGIINLFLNLSTYVPS